MIPMLNLPLGRSIFLSLSPSSSSLPQPLLLSLLGLRPVLVQQLEQLGGCKFKQSVQRKISRVFFQVHIKVPFYLPCAVIATKV